MKNSAIKIVRFLFNKKNVNKLKNNLNKKTVSLAILALLILSIFIYFLRPMFFNYDSYKQVFEKKVYGLVKTETKIRGSLSYRIFPTPRLLIEEVEFDFGSNNKKKTKIKKSHVVISPLKLMNLKDFKLKKLLILNQEIQVQSSSFKDYFNYFSVQEKKNIVLSNCDIFFLDNQKNKVFFKDFSLKEKFENNKHQINLKGNFAEKKFSIEFFNKLEGKKYLEFEVPDLNTSININFDSKSNLDNMSGELRFKILETIVLLNFQGKNDFVISNAFLRNKFLNSKIDGRISFKDNFYFDLNFGINEMNLRKLLFYYLSSGTGDSVKKIKVSKKINGRIKATTKSTKSFLGKIRDLNFLLLFENGNIKIKDLSAKLPQDSKLNSNILIKNDNNNLFLDFLIKFYSNNGTKFFRKFGIDNLDQDNISLFVDGSIDLSKNKINLRKIIKDENQKISKSDILVFEKIFNKNVINEGVLGLFDFFKIKKFAKEISS